MEEVCTTTLPGAWVTPGFCAYQVPVNIQSARGILSVGETDFLALERGTSSVIFCHDTDDDGLADTRLTVASENSINHGIAIYDDYLYASSDSTVYRWKINNGTFLEALGEAEVIINNMNEESNGAKRVGHSTRTLEFDEMGRLYISVGAVGNVDDDSFRSRIRRFDFLSNAGATSFPINFLDGEVFADGLRNEVGLAFDKHGILWGVENSADNLFREDLGGDIHQDNPAEELNRFKEEDAGKHWGYPQCWTEFDVPEPYGEGQGTIWAWPSFLNQGTVTDEECRTNTIPPIMALQGHSAPLGMAFYNWKDTDELPPSCPQQAAFPKEMDGYAFIAYHGSWNRDVPTGYKVVYVKMDQNGDPVERDPHDLLMHEPPNARWDDGFRPVDVSFDECGRLLVSSDGTRGVGSKIVRIESTALMTMAPTTGSPTTVAPTTGSPTTIAPTTSAPTTVAPTIDTITPTGLTSDTITEVPTEETLVLYNVTEASINASNGTFAVFNNTTMSNDNNSFPPTEGFEDSGSVIPAEDLEDEAATTASITDVAETEAPDSEDETEIGEDEGSTAQQGSGTSHSTLKLPYWSILRFILFWVVWDL